MRPAGRDDRALPVYITVVGKSSFAICYLLFAIGLKGRMISPPQRSRGGIGRRVRLRTVWGNPWRFESSREQAR